MSFADEVLRERVDREYRYNDYWIWAFPNLKPQIQYSLVVQDGPNASACFNKGQNSFFVEDPNQAAGFADPYLTTYLVRQAQQYAFLGLLKQFNEQHDAPVLSTTFSPTTNISYSVLHLPSISLELLIDMSTFLPYAVRSDEDHTVFGPSTSDLILRNYTSVEINSTYSILLPHRLQTLYNEQAMLEDFIVDRITLNPDLQADFFHAAPPDSATTPILTASDSPEYPLSEVHEFFEAGLWGGLFGASFNTSSVVIDSVFDGIPQVKNFYIGYPDYVQLLVELSDGFLITDAPAHRSRIILEHIRGTMPQKPIKWVVPSHHHRDHAGGVGDYLAAGAVLIIPEVAKDFYSRVNGGNFSVITYNQEKPFHLDDGVVQFTSFWHDENPHAKDWTYAIAGPSKTLACDFNHTSTQISDGSEFVVFNADVVSPGPSHEAATRWDVGYARQWLIQAIQDRIPRNSTVIGTHGSSEFGLGTQDSLANIADLAGLRYPEVGIEDWQLNC